MRIVLISTYELGRQPFGLASPAAWLRADGHEVDCADLAVGSLPVDAVGAAGLVAFYLPMHTATRLAAPALERVRRLNPGAHLCCYGLYAPLNETYLRSLGVRTILGGEFEPALRSLARSLAQGANGFAGTLVSFERVPFQVPDRSGLPPPERYAAVLEGRRRKVAGYTEASRGCKHMCRHCPVVPVYQGRFRIVPHEIVLADIGNQVEAGAEHICFGDPDFFNGPAHATRIVEELHQRYPAITYDVTIKIEHLRRHAGLIPLLKRTGCLFVTTAVESVDDAVLARLDKGHTREDFFAVARLFRQAELALAPTFIPFTPWTSWAGYRDLLRSLVDQDLVENVAPIQLALRLLIPAGSRLLELNEIRERPGEFDTAALVYRWRHADPSLDQLAARLLRLVDQEQRKGTSRAECFRKIWELAHTAQPAPLPEDFDLLPRTAIPYMNEPWYC